MPGSDTFRPPTAKLRALAERKLGQLSKSELPIRECYLFENDCFAGVRFETGAFCFLWKSPEDFATISRGELLIETVSISASSEVRRVA